MRGVNRQKKVRGVRVGLSFEVIWCRSVPLEPRPRFYQEGGYSRASSIGLISELFFFLFSAHCTWTETLSWYRTQKNVQAFDMLHVLLLYTTTQFGHIPLLDPTLPANPEVFGLPELLLHQEF